MSRLSSSTSRLDMGQRRRAPAPDLARGLTLALIALANIMIYLHDRPYGLRQHIIETRPGDNAVTFLLVVLVDGRAYPLFAALFGYGMVRIADRIRLGGADEREVSVALRRRSLWLIMFGLVHALLGFSGDILGWYGLIGMVLASLVRASNRVLLLSAGVWLVLASAVQGQVYSDATVTLQRSYFWSFAIGDPVEAALWRPLEWLMTPFGLLSVVSAVLVGMWVARQRIIEQPEDHLTLLRTVAGGGIVIGILGGIGMGLATIGVWELPAFAIYLLSWMHILTGILAGLGYLAFFVLLARRWHTGLISYALRATGERSLSAYLAQSIVFVALLPAYTLGLGAALGTAGAAALALGTWLLTVGGATLLAAAGRRGPAEVLLRRLS